MTGRSAPAVRVEEAENAGATASDAASALAGLAALAGGVRRIDPLLGGLTNRNYRVVAEDGTEYVARLSGAKSTLLAIDRDAECRNARLAAASGVGPEVVEFSPAMGVLLVKWVNGRTFDERDLDDPAQLSRVAHICAQLHAGPRFVSDFDMFAVQRRYLAIVRESGFRLPSDYLDFEPAVRRIEQVLRASATRTVPCHNDLLAANIIDDGARLWLIDYEYAGNNDACFELGNIWSEAELDADRLDHLVAAYVGRPSPVLVARARLFALMAKYGWTLWASIQDAVSEVDFDFWQWGMAKYVRAREEFRSPALEQLVSTVEASIRI